MNYENFIPEDDDMSVTHQHDLDMLDGTLDMFFDKYPMLAHVTVVMGWGFDPDECKLTKTVVGENAEPSEYELDRSAADCATVAADLARDRATDFYHHITQQPDAATSDGQ